MQNQSKIFFMLGILWIILGFAWLYPSKLTAAPRDASTAVGWVVGADGTILNTTDGGTTWVQQGNGGQIPSSDLSGVSAVDNNTAWAVGEVADGYGTILRTIDGGATWQRIPKSPEITNIGFLSVSALSAQTAWIGGQTSVILYTTNGGTTWTRKGQSAITTTVDFEALSAFDARNVWVGGGLVPCPTDDECMVLLHTTDGGDTWQSHIQSMYPITPSGHTGVITVQAINANTLWAVGGKGFFAYTSDGGQNWKKNDHLWSFDVNGVYAVDQNTAWVSTDQGGVKRTTDGGTTWITQTVPASMVGYYLLRVSGIDAQNIWISGQAANYPPDGVILHTADGGQTWITQTSVQSGLWGISFVHPSIYYFPVIRKDAP